MTKYLLTLLFAFSCFQLMAQVKTKANTNAKPVVNLAVSMANGKAIYINHCLTCHQADGGGVPNMNPPLIKTSYITGSHEQLIKVLLNGFSENVDIDGESYSNVMPAHDFLKDREIADVLTYVRKSFGNKSSAITEAQVKAVRDKNKKKTAIKNT
ncbi:c-type cytochrome [Mucilaginibacter sp. SJ]|uniref:c-type cytochrome n=1 Tax=Mucilaginibacter sp. SJ TaxID=3029053 RepID=UPI0023A93A59|nr:cytochrome c [Mucilaginibacter sp. SJ]WEA01882.1 cytochrome c [Mucilaginibacter sp. SJ]